MMPCNLIWVTSVVHLGLQADVIAVITGCAVDIPTTTMQMAQSISYDIIGMQEMHTPQHPCRGSRSWPTSKQQE